MRLSYSSLDVFLHCPLKFRYQVIDRISVPKSKEALFGTMMHSALEMLHDPKKIPPPTEAELLKYFSDHWKPEIFEREDEESARFNQAISALKNYYAKNYPGNFNVIDTEKRFEVPIKINDETHLLTGKIDRIDKLPDESFEVIDYKTVRKMPAENKSEDNLQLGVYHLGLLALWPKLIKENRKISVSLYYLMHGEKFTFMRKNDDADRTKEKVSKIICDILKSDYKPLQSPLCGWCGYQNICPLWKHKYKKEKSTIQDYEVEKMVLEYQGHKAEISKLNERIEEIKVLINSYCDDEGIDRVFSNNGYYLGRTLKKTYEYDMDLVKSILEPSGWWPDVIKIDSAKLKKISLQLPHYIREKIKDARKLAKEYKVFSFGQEKK